MSRCWAKSNCFHYKLEGLFPPQCRPLSQVSTCCLWSDTYFLSATPHAIWCFWWLYYKIICCSWVYQVVSWVNSIMERLGRGRQLTAVWRLHGLWVCGHWPPGPALLWQKWALVSGDQFWSQGASRGVVSDRWGSLGGSWARVVTPPNGLCCCHFGDASGYFEALLWSVVFLIFFVHSCFLFIQVQEKLTLLFTPESLNSLSI